MRRQGLLTAAAAAAVVLCCVLAILQYRWTGELARADYQRLREALQTALNLLSRDFNATIAESGGNLRPAAPEIEELGRDEAYAQRYRSWRSATSFPDLFRRIG